MQKKLTAVMLSETYDAFLSSICFFNTKTTTQKELQHIDAAVLFLFIGGPVKSLSLYVY